MLAIVKIINVLSGSFILLTCGTIVEIIKLLVNTQIAKSNIKSVWISALTTTIICITITFFLIGFTECINETRG
jgi:hypothetical protein